MKLFKKIVLEGVGSVTVPWCIRGYFARDYWRKKYSGLTILTFYNNGKSLFIEPDRCGLNTYYCKAWEWIPFTPYKDERRILISGMLPGRSPKATEVVSFQHLGHHLVFGTGSVAVIRLGNGMSPKGKQKIAIGPKEILYVAVKEGKIVSFVSRRQPLPCTLFNLHDKILISC